MILMGNIAIVSNRETWIEQIELIDDETDEPYDVSDAEEAHMRIVSKDDGSSISGTIINGTIVSDRFASGIIEWSFSEAQMRTLCPGEYDIGITIKFPDETKQVLAGTVSIIDGVVE
jgi:hypothetical protein